MPLVNCRQRHNINARSIGGTWNGNVSLVTSQLTLLEAAAGDPAAAALRLEALRSIPLLAESDSARLLAERFVSEGAFPLVAERDALHVAICATNGVEFLLTWNFKHLANVFLRDKISDTCESFGIDAPVICTPDELVDIHDQS